MFLRKRTADKKNNQTFLHPEDLHYFNEGTARRAYDTLGAHILPGKQVHFCVWAPAARSVSVIGDFNHWQAGVHTLQPVGTSGLWAGVVQGAFEGHAYKYAITAQDGTSLEKADPFAFAAEEPPRTASLICDLSYDWRDSTWMRTRHEKQHINAPMSIYEVHPGSWRRAAENRPLTYLELAEELPAYVKNLGFTHVELMPVMEHPFDGSWGYQVTGYYAPTRRFGAPQDFMQLIDSLHDAGIGVILDWVPSHFAVDAHGLSRFNGTALYEHALPQQGFHPDWGSFVFNYGRNEVRSFLISNALFWMDKYHIDTLRVDAVASMLYLDYSRKEGEWVPNRYGGRENIEAIDFLRDLNTAVYAEYPDAQVIAEESTAWPGVSHPAHLGGLGFGYKWDMGWMNDTLRYFRHDPVHRAFHHNDITFRGLYAFHENYILPLSHDEVVHGKGSLLSKMSGVDDWQKFAHLRCLYALMYAQPGKKLLFMGAEIGQWQEWNHTQSLDWHLLEYLPHQQVQKLIGHLNRIYRTEPALQQDCNPESFRWIEAGDYAQSVISFARMQNDDMVIAVFNFTPVSRHHYHLGVPAAGAWQEILNTDSQDYGGSGIINAQEVQSLAQPLHGCDQRIAVTLPPLGAVYLKWRSHEQTKNFNEHNR